jgi:hypothetical protein
MPDYIPAIKSFIENFQTDNALKQYRKFVNVYSPSEADIEAIKSKKYEINGLKFGPNTYGGENVFEFKVGETSFLIWGNAVEYIQSRAKA